MPALLTRIVGAPSSATVRSTAAVDEGLVGDVGADAGRAAARGADGVDGLGRRRLVEVDDGDGVAVGGETQGDRRADAAGGSGDDGDSLGHGWFLSGWVVRVRR